MVEDTNNFQLSSHFSDSVHMNYLARKASRKAARRASKLLELESLPNASALPSTFSDAVPVPVPFLSVRPSEPPTLAGYFHLECYVTLCYITEDK